MPIPLSTLSVALTQANARWKAAATPVSLLPDAVQKQMLGAVPSPEVTNFMAAGAQAGFAVTAPGFESAIDWRNHNGNHVSAVKNQGGCGSCVSFGCVGLTESMTHIEKGIWKDLSEADSHFCSSHGANCGGWWPDQCIDQIISRGVVDESLFPYASAFPGSNIWTPPPTCKVDPNRGSHLVKVTQRVRLADPTAAKNHLTNVGPVVGCMDVYQDFFGYSSGVYHHISGALAGGHCMLVIGYSETEQCWIVKNSWGTTWGEGGYGKIAYADLKFGGTFYPMYGATGTVVAGLPLRVEPLYSGTKCYFFNGKQYIRVTRGDTGPGKVDAGYPAPISKWGWGNFGKDGIDAALYSGTKCYFFSGKQYIRVTRGDTGPGKVDAGYPAPISKWGWGNFGKDGIDGALYSGTKCYFFSGNQYIRVTRGDTGPGTVDAGYPASVENWRWPPSFT